MLHTLTVVLALAGLALASVSGAVAAEPILIGVPVIFTGPGAFVGEAEKNTLEMLGEALNARGGIEGRPLKFIYYDTEGKPDVAVRLFKRLIEKDKVTAILGPTASWEAGPVKPIAEKEKMPTIMLASARAIIDPVARWVFKTPVEDRIVVARLLSHIKSAGLDQIALVTSQDGFGDGGRKEILEQAPEHGIKVVFDERYTMEDADLTPLLNKLKKTEAKAVVNWSSSRAPIVFAMNYKQVGLTLPHFQSHATLSKSFLDATGANSEGIMVAAQKIEGGALLSDADPQKKIISDYKAAYKAKWGKDANQFGAGAHDAFMILTAALRKAGTDPEKLRAAIEETRGYVGIGGVYTYSATNHGGLGKDSVVMYRATGGGWQLLK